MCNTQAMPPQTQTQLVIGLGTGRCGTKSLAYLLNRQIDAEVYHEKEAHKIGWRGSEKDIDTLLDWATHSTHLRLVGDVALYYLPYVDYILARQPTVKFLCFQRDCAPTVASYMRKIPHFNHWMEHEGIIWEKHKWDHCFPSYAVPDKQSAITLYWYDYYFTATRYQSLYPDTFKIFPTKSLNSKSGQQAIFAFLGIPESQMQFAVGIRLNPNDPKLLRQPEKMPVPVVKRIYRSLKRIWVIK